MNDIDRLDELEWNALIEKYKPSLRTIADDLGVDWIAPAEYMTAEEKFGQLCDLWSMLPDDDSSEEGPGFDMLADLLEDAPFELDV